MRPADRQSGIALIATLWIILALTATSIYFAHSVRMQQWQEANVASARQSEAAIEGALTYLSAWFEAAEKGSVPDPEDGFLCDAVAVGEASFWILGRPVAEMSETEPAFGLSDEAGKLNLNSATLDMLLGLPGMTEEVAQAIIDWRDADDEPLPRGAESESYSRLERAYQSKNAPFSSTEELRLVYGVDVALLFGRDTNLNGVVENREASPEISLIGLATTPAFDLGWLRYVTVWSREPQVRSDGSPRLNLNNRNSAEFEELVRSRFDGETATAVLAAARPGAQPLDSLVRFYLASGLTPEQFSQIDDDITTTDETMLTGLVNINTACETVLACLPGVDSDSARELVRYRATQAGQLDSVAWITEVLDRDAAIAAGPHITTRSYQFGADIAAVAEGGRGYRRRWALLDTSGDDMRMLYLRDRTALGWALGDAVRQEVRP